MITGILFNVARQAEEREKFEMLYNEPNVRKSRGGEGITPLLRGLPGFSTSLTKEKRWGNSFTSLTEDLLEDSFG